MPEEEMDVGKAKPIKVNYPGNSKKDRSTEPERVEKAPLEKIIEGGVVKRKKPVGRKIAEVFTGEDAKSVGERVLFDVVIPAIQHLIVDAGNEALNRIFLGGGRRQGAGRPQGNRVNYGGYYPKNVVDFERPGMPPREPQRSLSQKARMTHNFDEVILETRGEAEKVLDGLGLILEQYDVVSVSELYELLGETGSYTDDKWGWYDLRGSSVSRVREGYLLNLPKPSVIE